MRGPRANQNWATPQGTDFRWEHVSIEVLMDIRDELRRLNVLLHCHNFVRIPQALDLIGRNTKRQPKKRKRHKKTI